MPTSNRLLVAIPFGQEHDSTQNEVHEANGIFHCRCSTVQRRRKYPNFIYSIGKEWIDERVDTSGNRTLIVKIINAWVYVGYLLWWFIYEERRLVFGIRDTGED